MANDPQAMQDEEQHCANAAKELRKLAYTHMALTLHEREVAAFIYDERSDARRGDRMKFAEELIDLGIICVSGRSCVHESCHKQMELLRKAAAR